MHNSITACRLCNRGSLEQVLSLGQTPLADALLEPEQLQLPELCFPLQVVFCPHCSLVQLEETVSPEVLFCRKYPYYSSFSDALLRHSRENAERLAEDRKLDSGSLVVELASNDGYLLKNFVEQGIRVLGIDPAEGPARAAQEKGIPTLCAFFDQNLARQLRAEGQAADVIVANNVLAHVPDLNGFVEGIRILLKRDGVAVIEVPYVKDLVGRCEFDTIYHEHLCYFSATALDHLFRRHTLFLNHVERLPIHGGSLRLFVELSENGRHSVRECLETEKAEQVDQLEYYRDFSARVEEIKRVLLNLLGELKRQGKRIAAYGAAAKGSTLINYIGLGSELLDFVVDRNTHKQGLYMPGKRLPILSPAKLLEEMPDYVLLLSWNFAEEVFEQQKEYRSRGGRFIIPVPEPRVV
jgi:SAM-dependent methyltransferase